jgi:outer membrane protein
LAREPHRSVTATGTLVTHLNVFPMLATGHYYLKTDPRDIRPYGGLGIGAYSVERRVDLGFWTLNDSSWHFGFAPEIGVVLPTGAAGVVVATKFNYAFPSDGWNEVMYFNFNLGVEL